MTRRDIRLVDKRRLAAMLEFALSDDGILDDNENLTVDAEAKEATSNADIQSHFLRPAMDGLAAPDPPAATRSKDQEANDVDE